MKIAVSRRTGRKWGPGQRIGRLGGLALFSSLLLTLALRLDVPAAWGQNQTSQTRGPKDDLKQAKKAAERGDQALAAGRMQEALRDYTAAVRSAPGDLGIVRRAAAVRAQVVQKLVDQAEIAALDGDITTATDLMVEAVRIDPGNSIVAERLAQMRQMPKEYLPLGDKADYELKGPAILRPPRR